MQKILEIGSPAQELLLERINDSQIKDQVIILLGGIGDERAVATVIGAMVENKTMFMPNGDRINLSLNLALTNITVADVIWHHGGGIEIRKCPDNPKRCWVKWWKKNKATFTVKGIKQSRRYSNYPNYGIYRQPY